jgi:hypothetical protein
MIRWHWYRPADRGGTMPEFTTVSVQEAKLRTIPGRQGKFIAEFADYTHQVPKGQAGKLTIGEQEKHTTIRRQLLVAAKAMNIPLMIKRSGTVVYFWREDGGEAQPKAKRSYTRRRRSQDAIPTPDQPVDELGMVEEGIPEEESPEFGQIPV